MIGYMDPPGNGLHFERGHGRYSMALVKSLALKVPELRYSK